MFCHKCGTEIAEGAGFCHKCGTKVASAEVEPAAMPMAAETVAVQEPQQESAPSVAIDDINEFRTFVDNHIRTTTKFQSADDLINNSKPMRFALICFGIPALLGIVLGAVNIGGLAGMLLGLLILGGFFGYSITFIVNGVIRSNYTAKFSGDCVQTINPDELLIFLNEHLKTVSPYFHECGYLDRRGVLASIDKAVSNSLGEVTMCCVSGYKKQQLATICIRPDVRDRSSRKTQYFVGAVRKGFLIDGRAAGFLGHACLIKTAPIMQAAIEFYLKNNNI